MKQFNKVLTDQELQSPTFRGSKLIGQLTNEQFHSQVRPRLSLINDLNC